MDHKRIQTALNNLYDHLDPTKLVTTFDDGLIKITAKEDLSELEKQAVKDCIFALLPWRKGPFQILDTYIDSEWRAEMKWDRFKSCLGDLAGLKVADVGCSNGYYCFRTLEHNCSEVIGFDPYQFCHYQFSFLNYLINDPRLSFKLEGVEDFPKYPSYFDVAYYMGILPHRRQPLESLKNLITGIKPGGYAVIESMILSGADLNLIEIPDRYSKMKNVYYLTTENGLCHLIEQAGFKDLEIININQTSIEEQRSTEFMIHESLVDFLDPNDSSKTLEGYPAPTRMIVKAWR